MTSQFITDEQFVQHFIDTSRKTVDAMFPEKTEEERRELSMQVTAACIGASCPFDGPMRMG